MEFKKSSSFGRKLTALCLAISFVVPASYSSILAPRAQAFLGIGDINLESIPTIVKFALETIGSAMAQRMVDDMVKQSVDWANSGFEDNPAFVTDLEGFLIETADAVAGEYIAGTDLDFLCSPFQNNIRLSLRAQYNIESGPVENRLQCTISDIQGNVENFFDGDFINNGGWDTWFAVTQNSANNPYGAYLEAKMELDSRILNRLSLEQEQLDWNKGFLSWSECIKTDPETGKCLKRGKVQTPGSVINNQINTALGSGMARLISADSLDQLISAFASGLLQRYVFGSQGLFASGNTTSYTREILDIDSPSDGIPDGWDYDGDGQLDICHHGLINPDLPPNNANCLRSSAANNSPFFIPICEALNNSISQITQYQSFITTNSFMPERSNTWLNRTVTVAGAVDGFEGTLARYEIAAYDEALFAIGKYLKEMNKRIANLSKDGVLHDNRRFRPDEGAADALRILRSNNASLLNYLRSFQANIGQCDAPNVNALTNLQPPVIEVTPDDVVPGPDNSILSCSPSTITTAVGTEVVWTSQTSLINPSYSWSGNDITSGTNSSISVTYQSPGIKIASVTASGIDANGTEQSMPVLCTDPVNVTGSVNGGTTLQ